MASLVVLDYTSSLFLMWYLKCTLCLIKRKMIKIVCRCHHKMNHWSVCFVTDTQIAASYPTLRPTNAQWSVDRVLGTKLADTVLYHLIIITTQHTYTQQEKGENVCQSHYCLSCIRVFIGSKCRHRWIWLVLVRNHPR